MIIYNSTTVLTLICHIFARAFFITNSYYSVFSSSVTYVYANANVNVNANADDGDIVVMIQPQSDLTVEEQEILSQINNNDNNASKPLRPNSIVDVDADHEQEQKEIISRVVQSIQNEKDELSDTQRQIEEHTTSILKRADIIESMYKEIVGGTEELILTDVVNFNVRQLQALNERILISIEEELERRTMEPDVRIIEREGGMEEEEEFDGDNGDDDEDDDDDNDEDGFDLINKITKSELESMLAQSLQNLIQQSQDSLYIEIDEQLSNYIETKIMPHQLSDFDRKVQQKTIELDQAEETLESIVNSNEYKESMAEGKASCTTKSDVLNMVQSSIWKFDQDGGLLDYLSDGRASIVYGEEWTSSTYTPPKTTTLSPLDTSIDGSKKITLGDYERYIPEDWERFLPDGWEDLDISPIHKFFKTDPRLYVPTSIWHSLPNPLAKLVSPLGSPVISKPPETIMDRNTNLGSCWAMAGSSGKVTMQLERPLTVQSITIDHCPGVLFSSDSEGGDAAHSSSSSSSSSAPRFVRAVGYPPCKDEDRDSFSCIKYGFDTDTSAVIDLGSFEYKPVPRVHSTSVDNLIEGNEIDGNYPRRSTQTFAVGSGALILDGDVGPKEEKIGEEKEEGDNNDMFGGGSCSATKPSCGAVYDSNESVELPPVAAVSIIIDENWGHEDYTCIYRVRIHGV